MFDMDIGIDLGTANVLVYVKGKGVVIDQPSVVAFEKGSKKILAIGTKAKKMMGKEPANISVIRPLRKGVISDYTVTERMLKAFIKTAMAKKTIVGKPKVCVCVPSGVTEVEKRAVEDAVYHTGARSVYIMEEPVAAAVGAHMDIADPVGNMIVDIGGGTTDVAVISLGGIVVNNSLKVAGDDFDEAIVKYMRRKYSLLIGEPTAEKMKMQIGSVYPRDEEVYMEVKGRNLINGLPQAITVSSSEMIDALGEITVQVMDAILSVLEVVPPELSADIAERGITLSGGGSLIYGLDIIIEKRTGISAHLVESPLESVALGAGNAMEFLSKINGKG